MAEFNARVGCAVGCLDQFTAPLERAGGRLESFACLAQDGGDGVVTFSVESDEKALSEVARPTGVPVLQVKVPNEIGCLTSVTTSLGKAGVTIGSLACACGAGDASGIVSVGLQPRG